METETGKLERLVERKYEHGFVTDIESDTVPPGLNEDVIRQISKKKAEPEWLLEWRLEAYRHWQTMPKPDWAKLNVEPIDYQSISYFSAPKSNKDRPQSLDDVDPKLLETYDKLGVPLHERARLAGVAVDAVFDVPDFSPDNFNILAADSLGDGGNLRTLFILSGLWFLVAL